MIAKPLRHRFNIMPTLYQRLIFAADWNVCIVPVINDTVSYTSSSISHADI